MTTTMPRERRLIVRDARYATLHPLLILLRVSARAVEGVDVRKRDCE